MRQVRLGLGADGFVHEQNRRTEQRAAEQASHGSGPRAAVLHAREVATADAEDAEDHVDRLAQSKHPPRDRTEDRRHDRRRNRLKWQRPFPQQLWHFSPCA